MVLITCIRLHSVYQRVSIFYPSLPEQPFGCKKWDNVKSKKKTLMKTCEVRGLSHLNHSSVYQTSFFFSLFQYQQRQGVSLSLSEIK